MLTLESNPLTDDCAIHDWNPISIDFKMANRNNNATTYENIARIAAVMCPTGGSSHDTQIGEGSNALTFWTSKGSSVSPYPVTTTEKMRINHNGNVGIGTNDPQCRLHTYVNGNNYTRIQSSTGTEAALEFYDSASRWVMYKPGNSTDLRFYGNSADRVTFKADGKVGIGTNNPDKKLHVMVADTGYSSHGSASMVLEGSSSNFLNFITTNGQSSGLLFGNSSNTAHGGVIYQDAGNMMFRTGSNQTRMVIDQSGEVGIGNTAPSQKLEVTGNIKIDNGQTGSGLSGGKLMFDSAYGVTGVNKISLLGERYGFGVDDNTLKHISGGIRHRWYYSSSSGQNGTLGMTLELSLIHI